MSGYHADNPMICTIGPKVSGFSRRFLEESKRVMPYKDAQKQREYLRNWRQEQKQRKVTQLPLQALHHSDRRYVDNKSTGATSLLNPSSVSFYQPTIGQPHRVRFSYQSAQLTNASEVDQRALKISPDGAPQTGRDATRAYQLSRGRHSAPVAVARSIHTRQPSASLAKRSSRHLAVPIAAILVELLSRLL
jgi:hypothetical protein